MPLDLSQWTGALALPEVEVKPAQVLVVKYESLEIDELGKVLTPTQVVVHNNSVVVVHKLISIVLQNATELPGF